MQNTITEQLKEVSTFRQEKPEEIIAEAVDIGLQKMWLDIILSQYLKKQISRRKAIQIAGLDLVRLTEHQDKIAQNDLKWGIKSGSNRR